MNNTNNKQVLWLATEFFYPEFSAATGYFLTGIAEKLSEEYNVNVICASSHKKNNKRVKTEKWNSINIIRLNGSSIGKNNLLLRLIKFFYLSIQFFFTLIFKCKKNSKLCVVTNPAPLVILGAIISKIKKIEYIIIVHDIFPENIISAKIISSNSLLYKSILPIFNWAYFKANILISMGSDMSKVLKKKLPNYGGKIKIIPNWSDTNDIQVTSKLKNQIIKEKKLQKKIVFTFAGNIGRAQGIPELIKSINNVSNLIAHFLFFGNGAMLNDILFAENNFKNISYGGSYPRSEKNLFLSASDVSIISLSKNMTGLGVPSKTYDSLAAGRPLLVISDINSDIAQLVIKHNIGWVCPPGDTNSFDVIVNSIINNPKKLKTYSKNSRLVAVNFFSKEIVLNKYLETL